MKKSRIVSLLLALLLVGSLFQMLPLRASAASAVRIGHASQSESGTANGEKGDQTGKEVATRDWYNGPWTIVIRAKDAAVAEKIAYAMEQACANNNIGYGQSDRGTLYTQAKNAGWDLSKITVKCNTDCSALVAVCVNAAGIKVSGSITTGNERSTLINTGKFEEFTSSDYIGASAKLRRGDILLRPKTSEKGGHTAVVLTNGSNADPAPAPDPTPAPDPGETPANGMYYPACDASYHSISDALKSVGVDNSYAHRKVIAAKNNIENYSGTGEQNSLMLQLLKQGKLLNPEYVAYYPACDASYHSISDALKSVGVDNSYAHRKLIAAANNIANYSGTAEQNSLMLQLLKQGRLIQA